MKCNFRVYTKYKKIGDNYYEATYKEYTKDGRLVATGSEDFRLFGRAAFCSN